MQVVESMAFRRQKQCVQAGASSQIFCRHGNIVRRKRETKRGSAELDPKVEKLRVIEEASKSNKEQMRVFEGNEGDELALPEQGADWQKPSKMKKQIVLFALILLFRDLFIQLFLADLVPHIKFFLIRIPIANLITSFVNRYINKILPMSHSLPFGILILLVIVSVQAAPKQDLFDHDIHVKYLYPWYSGYLNFSKSSYHYTFFESQGDTDNDPLVLWLNGGPGCSSMIGMMTQNGPFLFQPNTSTLALNPYAWNKQANVLYIESPGGVGFSRGQRKTYNDANTAQDNLQALLAFFQKFPNLKKNDFYMTGESYAGIYVPYLAHEIIKFNKLPSSKQKIIKLKGIMVGNACTHPRECYEATAEGNSKYFYQFLYKHAYYSDVDYMRFQGACGMSFQTEQCVKMREQLDKKFENTNTSILNIYAPCYYQVLDSPNKRSQRIHRSKFGNPLVTGDMDCQDNFGIHHFFNIPGMYLNLHVDHVKWEQCSDYISQTYQSFSNASYWIYPIMIKEGLRVWVYSGDVDADVPITGTLDWINMFREEQGLPIVEPWRQWWVQGLHKHEDQVGGMVWELKNLTFVSVKGAGHLVPKDKPKQALTLLTSFLSGSKLPYKDESL